MRRMSSARRGPFVLCAVVVLGGGLVSGCTGSDPAPAPTTLHPGTPATATSATPSSDPTDVAGAAAIAAVQRLYAELNIAIHSGSTGRYKTTFSRECTICEHDAEATDAIYRRGQHVVGGTYHVAELLVVWNTPDLIIVQGVLSADALTVLQQSRVVARNAALRPSEFTWNVEPHAGRWLVTEVEVMK